MPEHTALVPASPDALPAPSDGAVASPVVASTAPDGGDLARLVDAYRVLQMHHARVLNHESVARGLGATDTRLVLYLASTDGNGVTPKQAGDHLELSTGATTSLVDRLERHGHIERRPNPEDRRSILVHLTASGSVVARQISGVYSAAFREVVPVEHRGALADAFALLGQALERHSQATSG